MKSLILYFLTAFLVLASMKSDGQTNPVPQQVPMSQDHQKSTTIFLLLKKVKMEFIFLLLEL